MLGVFHLKQLELAIHIVAGVGLEVLLGALLSIPVNLQVGDTFLFLMKGQKMIMQKSGSGDEFGVNFNWDNILLQITSNNEKSQTRIKLNLKDVDTLVQLLEYYQIKLSLWKEAVGPQKEGETTEDLHLRALQTLKENNFFVEKQEE